MPNVGPYIYIYIYTTLAFLALLGAPYIYEISSLRVNNICQLLESNGGTVPEVKPWLFP